MRARSHQYEHTHTSAIIFFSSARTRRCSNSALRSSSALLAATLSLANA